MIIFNRQAQDVPAALKPIAQNHGGFVNRYILIMVASMFVCAASCYAAPTASEEISIQPSNSIYKSIHQTLSSLYADCEIEISSEHTGDEKAQVSHLGEVRPGTHAFLVGGERQDAQFHAWKSVLVAKRRILPKEKITSNDFTVQKVDLTQGSARDLRGILVGESEITPRIEAKRTIIQGQKITVDAIQKMADAKRGEAVSLKIRSGEVLLMSPATLLEDAREGQRVKVISSKTKKEFSGILNKDLEVEVNL